LRSPADTHESATLYRITVLETDGFSIVRRNTFSILRRNTTVPAIRSARFSAIRAAFSLGISRADVGGSGAFWRAGTPLCLVAI
jgi:hypothetical protein